MSAHAVLIGLLLLVIVVLFVRLVYAEASPAAPPDFDFVMPEFMRRTPAMLAEEHERQFARIALDDPSFRALCELGREDVLAYLQQAADARQDERSRLVAVDRAMTLVRFLERANYLRERARQQQSVASQNG